MRVLVLNGPNLNLLGTREPEVYGRETLADIEMLIRNRAEALGIEIAFHQSNHEGELVDLIQLHRGWDGLILNPGGYTHTSVAIPDAILAVGITTVEVHLSNIFKREEFRHHSYVSPTAWGCVMGFGFRGYLAALDLLYGRLTEGAAG
ncbi:MAG: type II 3-dehydroquinate dehydratase [Chloroflexota bacterium]|nr:MAG: type II 3-dehydroquinate dehydratase [Chloroflexota bacterium]